MKITAIGDLHGDTPALPGGDLLIVSGDLTARDKAHEYAQFKMWIEKQDYKKKVVIGGNHDTLIFNGRWVYDKPYDFEYLCDSGTEFEYEEKVEEDHKFKGTITYKQKKKLKLWGTPWTQWFEGVNPLCTAFMLQSEVELAEKYDMIPDDTDILITHGPRFEVLDRTLYKTNAGSKSLLKRVDYLKGKQLKFHIHGHIHEAHGKHEEDGLVTLNVSRMDRLYNPKNQIVNFEI